MLAVTVRPEWAHAIVEWGVRTISKDFWPDALDSQEWIAVHAGKYIGGKDGDRATMHGLISLSRVTMLHRYATVVMIPFVDPESGPVMAVKRCLDEAGEGEIIRAGDIIRSAIVGVCQIRKPRQWIEYTWAVPGRVPWHLSRFIPVPEPLEYGDGNPGLWQLPQDFGDRLVEYTR